MIVKGDLLCRHGDLLLSFGCDRLQLAFEQICQFGNQSPAEARVRVAIHLALLRCLHSVTVK